MSDTMPGVREQTPPSAQPTPQAHYRHNLNQVNRRMNASAVSATSRQPLSIVSACPRLGISTISVTQLFRCSRLNDALAIAHGTVLSFSPEMISSGPRSGVSLSTFASVHGLRFAE